VRSAVICSLVSQRIFTLAIFGVLFPPSLGFDTRKALHDVPKAKSEMPKASKGWATKRTIIPCLAD